MSGVGSPESHFETVSTARSSQRKVITTPPWARRLPEEFANDQLYASQHQQSASNDGKPSPALNGDERGNGRASGSQGSSASGGTIDDVPHQSLITSAPPQPEEVHAKGSGLAPNTWYALLNSVSGKHGLRKAAHPEDDGRGGGFGKGRQDKGKGVHDLEKNDSRLSHQLTLSRTGSVRPPSQAEVSYIRLYLYFRMLELTGWIYPQRLLDGLLLGDLSSAPVKTISPTPFYSSRRAHPSRQPASLALKRLFSTRRLPHSSFAPSTLPLHFRL